MAYDMLILYKRHLIIAHSVILLLLGTAGVSVAQQAEPALANQTVGDNAVKKDVEVCGIVGTTIDPNDSDVVDKYLKEITSSARARWKASLEKQASKDVRSLGLLLHYDDVFSYKVPGSSEAALVPLIKVAMKSRSPAIYAIAYNVCRENHLNVETSHCGEISEKHWIEIDQDNATPWLLLAEKYAADGDQRHFDEAIEEASKGKRVESYAFAFFHIVQTSLLPRLTPLEKDSIWEYVIQTDKIPLLSGSDVVVEQACSADAAKTDQRSRECHALADILVNHSSKIGDMAIGVKVGEQIGWQKERVDKAKQRMLTLSSVALRERYGRTEANKNDLNVKFDCQMIERSNKYFERIGQLGEVGAAEYYLSQSEPRLQE